MARPHPNLPSPPIYTAALPDFGTGWNQHTDDSLMPFSGSPLCYNIEVEQGTLTRATGFAGATLAGLAMAAAPATPYRVLLYRGDAQSQGEVLYLLTATNLYAPLLFAGALTWQSILTLPSGTTQGYAVNYIRDGSNMLVVGRGTDMITYSGTGTSCQLLTGRPAFTRAALHYERLFGVGEATHPGRVYFSAQFDPTDFTVSATKGGYIDILGDRGKALDIVSFADSLYIFWQYGITRLDAYDLQSDFAVRDCVRLQSELIPGSVQVCGGEILFACRNGIYSFNGSSLALRSQKISRFFNPLALSSLEADSAWFSGRYYLSLPVAGGSLVRYQPNDRFALFTGYYPRQFKVLRTQSDGEGLLFCQSNRLYCYNGADTYADTPIAARWDTPLSHLGRPETVKRLTGLSLPVSGQGSLRVTVRTEAQERVYEIALRDTRRVVSLPVNLRGRYIGLRLENVGGGAFTLGMPQLFYTPGRD